VLAQITEKQTDKKEGGVWMIGEGGETEHGAKDDAVEMVLNVDDDLDGCRNNDENASEM